MAAEPVIKVGIMSGKKIRFTLFGDYRAEGVPREFSGVFTAELHAGKIVVSSGSTRAGFGTEVTFMPTLPDSEYFSLRDVVIGIQFHWERKEKQSFRGALTLLADGGQIVVINQVGIEDYLASVISSEMSARSSTQLLKAHAVISRSWLLAQIEKSNRIKKEGKPYNPVFRDSGKLIKWYDREDHTHYDVCADDHCQRYQGITKIHTDAAKQGVAETRGLVLAYGGAVCDARFSKSCGGISESFENVWEPEHFPYLVPVYDYRFPPDDYDTDFSKEKNARAWITSAPQAFCNTSDKNILAQVLLDYDQETRDFYRWKVEYTQEELSALIKEKTGIDFGGITALEPVLRGPSSRLIELRIVGTKTSLVIGKELEIRKTLSKSHLYSSAFVVDTVGEAGGIPAKFILTGAGWGHGVGLCQIGAAVMAEKGHRFDEILLHYYRHAELKKIY